MTMSSMRVSFTDADEVGHVGCTRKTSHPRMDSFICT
jgi:hypothetical protein